MCLAYVRLESEDERDEPMPPLFNKTIDVLSGMLDYRAKRHQVILSNISNLDTPGYKAADLTFRKDLQAAQKTADHTRLVRTDSRHISSADSKHDVMDYEIEQSEDKVKLDTEMANLSGNHLMYNLTVDLLARKFRGLQTVLKEAK